MTANFGAWLTHRVGGKWCVAPRMSQRLRDKGYVVALPMARYHELTREWERENYGATLEALRVHAPAMLETLKAIANRPLPNAHTGGYADVCHELQDLAVQTIQIVEAA